MVGQGLTSESDTVYPWFQALNFFPSTDKCDSMVNYKLKYLPQLEEILTRGVLKLINNS